MNITGGPLQYQHRAEALFLHWGRGQGGSGGSEHSINHMSWAGEIQIYGYNTQLYSNLSQVRALICKNEKFGLRLFSVSRLRSSRAEWWVWR